MREDHSPAIDANAVDANAVDANAVDASVVFVAELPVRLVCRACGLALTATDVGGAERVWACVECRMESGTVLTPSP